MRSHVKAVLFFLQQNSFIKSIKKPVRAQNYRHLHFTLTMILMISNIYDIYKKNKNKYR